MKSKPIIDGRVILTMIASTVLALIVFAFRYQTVEPYFPVTITVKGDTLYADELLKFSAEGKDIATKSIVWDFGDKSNQYVKTTTAIHSYKTPGRYDIILTINGSRHIYKTVYIRKAKVPIIDSLKPQFTGPNTATLGEPVIFKDSTPNALKWKWYFGENIGVDATTQIVTHTFTTVGWKEVILVVNDSIHGTHLINIEPKPDQPETEPRPSRPHLPPIVHKPTSAPIKVPTDTESIRTTPVPRPKSPPVTNSQFETMLKQFVDEKIKISDFLPYVCQNSSITINVNDKTQKSFAQFCEEFKKDVKKSDNIKKLEVSFEKGENTNCIKSIIVKYKKYGWIGRIFN